MSSGPRRRRQYSKAEWDDKKDFIAQLVEDGKKQKEILDELDRQDPDFRPTLPMLKKRMGQWGIASNHKEADIVEAVRIAQSREKQKKKTVFLIGGKTVTQEEIMRYLRRKGVRNPKAWAASKTDVKKPASTIVPVTPDPSTPASSGDDSGFESLYPSNRPADPSGDNTDPEDIEEISNEPATALVRRTVPDIFFDAVVQDLHLFGTVQTPHTARMLSQAMINTDRYCEKMFHLESIIPGISDLTDDSLNAFTNGMWKGWDFLFDDNVPTAIQYFDEGFENLDALIKSPNRRFLPELLEMLLNLQLEPQFDILGMLLKYLSDLTHVDAGANELLLNLFDSLLELGHEDRLEVVERLMHKVLEHFERQMGTENAETKSIKKALTRSVYRKLPVSKAIQSLESFLRKDEMSLYDKCNVCIELALCYRSKGDIFEAENWVSQAKLLATGLKSIFHRTDINVRCYRVMSVLDGRKGNWKRAHTHWLNAVEESSIGLGPTDSLTVLVESELADFMSRCSLSGITLVEDEEPSPVPTAPPVPLVPVATSAAVDPLDPLNLLDPSDPLLSLNPLDSLDPLVQLGFLGNVPHVASWTGVNEGETQPSN